MRSQQQNAAGKKKRRPGISQCDAGPPAHNNTWQRKRYQFVPVDDGRTHQSFKDECDINQIIELHHRTGIVNHVQRTAPQYGEVPDQTLFEAACAQAEIRSAQEEGFDFTPDEPEASSEADLDADASEAVRPSTEAQRASQEPTEAPSPASE